MTILYDDRGLVVDKTESFLKKYENIGIMASGGTDSSFLLWWLAKCITDLKLYNSHILLPIHGIDRTRLVNTTKDIKKIINFIQIQYPKVEILEPYIIKYRTKEDVLEDVKWNIHTKKSWYFKPYSKKIQNGLVDIIIGGLTSAPIHDDVDLGYLTYERNYKIYSKKFPAGSHGNLLLEIDKKFIAYQYKKFNLMEDFFPLTKTCFNTVRYGVPCKSPKCTGCTEKYWAFGCYDGGVK